MVVEMKHNEKNLLPRKTIQHLPLKLEVKEDTMGKGGFFPMQKHLFHVLKKEYIKGGLLPVETTKNQR